ncbi:MAG: SHOCT domain-containing protein [Nitrososphaeraceae archaeon]|nr:SHOCT domain-containing protein [Nitrososphaeraceae archaeon]
MQQQTVSVTTKTDKSNSNMNYDDNNNEGKKVVDKEEEDPVRIIKRRLAKGEISKDEYEELRKAIQS